MSDNALTFAPAPTTFAPTGDAGLDKALTALLAFVTFLKLEIVECRAKVEGTDYEIWCSLPNGMLAGFLIRTRVNAGSVFDYVGTEDEVLALREYLDAWKLCAAYDELCRVSASA